MCKERRFGPHGGAGDTDGVAGDDSGSFPAASYSAAPSDEVAGNCVGAAVAAAVGRAYDCSCTKENP